jgi:hypothetical protein
MRSANGSGQSRPETPSGRRKTNDSFASYGFSYLDLAAALDAKAAALFGRRSTFIG